MLHFEKYSATTDTASLPLLHRFLSHIHINACIINGDKAFIRKTHDYENGKVYAVVLKGENQATLKRFHQEGDTVVLSPCNPNYQTIITKSEDICFVGECVGTYHAMK